MTLSSWLPPPVIESNPEGTTLIEVEHQSGPETLDALRARVLASRERYLPTLGEVWPEIRALWVEAELRATDILAYAELFRTEQSVSARSGPDHG